MSRKKVLLVVPPLTGHINPARAVAGELKQRGYQIAWALHVDEGKAGGVGLDFPSDEHIYPLTMSKGFFEEAAEKSTSVRGLESVRFLYEDFCIPIAKASYSALNEITKDYEPDLMLVDHQMIAGAMVARHLNIPWFTLATTTASILKMWDGMDGWMEGLFKNLYQACQLSFVEGASRIDFSPYGVLVFSVPSLIDGTYPFYPANYHFVGVCSSHRATIDFPWQDLDESKKKIFISLGTVSRDRALRYYRVMMEALADKDIQVVMVAPSQIADDAPDNFIVQERVPQLELLKQMDAVICHAGNNTVCEALREGLPLIVSPIRDDQPVIAKQVVDAGAGIYLRFGKATVNMASKAVDDILNDVTYSNAAKKSQRDFLRCEGASQAADVLEAEVLKKRKKIPS